MIFPFRIEFFGDQVETIRTFDTETQLSKVKVNKIQIIPNVQDRSIREKRCSFFEYIPESTCLWFDDVFV